MIFETKYKVLLWKSYFDKGLGVTAYFKYMIAFFGIASLNVKATMYIAIGYAIFCFFLGFFWYRYKWIEAEHEVANRYNRFMKEMRNSKIFKGKK